MKTYYAKPGEVEREWVLIDAEDQVLGRLATKAAHILRGKHIPVDIALIPRDIHPAHRVLLIGRRRDLLIPRIRADDADDLADAAAQKDEQHKGHGNAPPCGSSFGVLVHSCSFY